MTTYWNKGIKKFMSKVIPSKISKQDREKMFDLLCFKIASLKNKKQVIDFLSDVLTESEALMILRRLQIAKMLIDECTYFEIRQELQVGIDTIRTVRTKLLAGSGGYLNFIKKLKK